MIAVVIAANRVSPIASGRAWPTGFGGGSNGVFLGGDLPGDSGRLFGRHFRTASTEALQGWTWRGYENITRITMAALATVALTEDGSTYVISNLILHARGSYKLTH